MGLENNGGFGGSRVGFGFGVGGAVEGWWTVGWWVGLGLRVEVELGRIALGDGGCCNAVLRRSSALLVCVCCAFAAQRDRRDLAFFKHFSNAAQRDRRDLAFFKHFSNPLHRTPPKIQ